MWAIFLALLFVQGFVATLLGDKVIPAGFVSSRFAEVGKS